MQTKILYKSISKNKTSYGHKWQLNQWYKIDKPLRLCGVGFHASQNIIDAMNYVAAGYVAKVEVRRKSIIEDEKECWSDMRIIQWAKWNKKDSISLAIFSAELVLANYEKEFPNDNRPRQAIEAAKKTLKKDNKLNRSVAVKSAWLAKSAAWASWSAGPAAWGVWSAGPAGPAAWGVWSAKSAESAAWAAKTAALSAKSAESAAWASWAVKSAAWAAECDDYTAQIAVSSANLDDVIGVVKRKINDGKEKFQEILTKCHDFVIHRKKLN